MSDFEWTLESRQPFMDGKTQYNLRRPGLMGIRGYVTLSHAEHEDLTRRLSDTPGIVRVDTNDEALVERLAVVLWQDDYDREVIVSHTFTETFPAYQNDYRRRVRAVLAALREAAQ